MSTSLPQNGVVADQLELRADLSELLGDEGFRVTAYRRAGPEFPPSGSGQSGA